MYIRKKSINISSKTSDLRTRGARRFRLPKEWVDKLGMGDKAFAEYCPASKRVAIEIDAGSCQLESPLLLTWGDEPEYQKVMERSQDGISQSYFASFSPGRRQLLYITISLVQSAPSS